MGDLGNKIIEKIKEEKITPKPRWQFKLRDCFVWFLFLVSLVLGSLAFCVALSVFFTNDWDLYRYLHTSLIGHILVSIPYAWIVFLIFFVGVAYYNFKSTRNGYRRETYIIVTLSVAGSIILGIFLHALGAGEKIEDAVTSSIPLYEKLTCCKNRKDIWTQPQAGLLGGIIIEKVTDKDFELRGFDDLVWRIQEDDNTIEYEPLEIKSGEEVKIIGEKKQDYLFWAREIRPWKKKGEPRRTKAEIEE